MKFLITGGAGFIGSYLSEELVSRGDQVVVLDNLSTGKNIDNHNLDLRIGSILNEELVESAISDCDQVIHLAAAVGVFNIVNNPLQSLITNITGTEIVLRLSSKFNRPVFLASSSEIYGKNTKIPLTENSDRILGSPLVSRWSYSEAKAIDESMAYFYYREKNLDIKMARFFNTVGPRQVGDYGMVMPRFIESAIKGQPIYIYGDGSQTRCFTHVKDVVRAILLIIDSSKSTGEIFNIGNDKQISILSLAKHVLALTQSKSNLIFIPYEKAYGVGFEDMERRVPDISKIKNILGWSPEIGLDEIIKDIATFYTS